MSDEQKAAVRDIVSDLTGLDIETQLGGRSAPLPVSTHRVWSGCGFTPPSFLKRKAVMPHFCVFTGVGSYSVAIHGAARVVAATGGIKHSVALS